MPFNKTNKKHDCEGTIPNALGFSDKRGMEIATDLDKIIKSKEQKIDENVHGVDASVILLEVYEKYNDKELAFALFTLGRKIERLTNNPIEQLIGKLVNSLED